MPEDHQPNGNPKKPNRSYNNVTPRYMFWILVGGGIAFVALLLTSIYWPNLTERTKFFTGNLLSLVVTLAVIAQVLIYRNQWQIERARTDPRLRVSKIRIENFEAGQSPIFITTIANDGLIDATGVELHIGIKLGHFREFKWIEPQTVMIPARGEESYPIVTGASLSDQDMEGLNSDVPIEVKVRVKYWPGSPIEPKEFCYRYLPWPNQNRPNDVRQFFPCDFNPGLNIGLNISGVEAKITTYAPTIVQRKVAGESKPQEETKPENEDNGNPADP